MSDKNEVLDETEIQKIAYRVFSGFNELELQAVDVERCMEYMYKNILPYQLRSHAKTYVHPAFKSVTPETLQ